MAGKYHDHSPTTFPYADEGGGTKAEPEMTKIEMIAIITNKLISWITLAR